MSSMASKIRNANCKLCDLHKSAQTVCVMGNGDNKADLFLVGEAPGYREDELGKPFAGKSGKLLDAILQELDIDRSEVYISNVVHCKPPDNRTPTLTEIKTCVPYLEKELEYVKPKVIILLGNVALRGVTKRSGITKYRGTKLVYEGENFTADVFPTFHPAAILRNPGNMSYLVKDIERAVNFLRGESTEDEVNYEVLNTYSKIKEYVRLIKEKGFVTFDVETTGLNWWDKEKRLVTLGFSCEDNRGVVIPFEHPENPFSQLKMNTIVEHLRTTVFENRKIMKLAQNLKFDAKWTLRYGMPLKGEVNDTMLAHYLLDENSRHGLDALSLEYTDYGEYWTDVLALVKQGRADEVPLAKLAKYNATDCVVTTKLWEIFSKRLKKRKRLQNMYDTLLMPLSSAMTNIEGNGMLVDVAFCDKLVGKFDIEILRLIKSLFSFKACRKYVKHRQTEDPKFDRINLNSPKQIAELLFTENGFNMKPIKETKSGAPSADEEVLIKLMGKKRTAKFASQLLELRKVVYLNSHFAEGMDKFIGSDNRVHTNFKIHGTVTGRMSSSDPNLHNIPRAKQGDYDTPLKMEIKKMFIAPPGKSLLQVDYSQAELRVMADFADERNMKRWFKEGRDIHLAVACKQLGKKPEDITDEERKAAKTINFAIIYCAGPSKLAEGLSSPAKGIFYTNAQSQEFMDEYFAMFPAIKQCMDDFKRRATEKGFVTTRFGRRRRLPNIQSDLIGVREEALRQSVNSPIQGTAADYANFAIVRLMDEGLPKGVRIVNTVHDSILFEVPEGLVKSFGAYVKHTCENLPTKKYFGFELLVPMKVDVEYGKNWGALKELKFD